MMEEENSSLLFPQKLKDALLNQDLGGYESHKKMAPLPHRLKEKPHASAKRAAVLILCYNHNATTNIALIKRTSSPHDPHSGQIALPGGRHDVSDHNLMYTAIRETKEEIGISLDQNNIIGPLSELFIPVSQNIVSPFIGFLSSKPSFVLEAQEVESIIDLPIHKLLNDDIRQKKIIDTSYATNFEVPGFQYGIHWIWGATAMILEEFSDLLKKI